MNEIRKLGLEELDPFVLLMANAYPGIGLSTQEAQNRLRERWMQAVRDDAPTAFYGYFRDGRMIGGMRWYKYMINVHGVRLQAAGIGSVAVDLLHKKEKVAKEMLAFFLQTSREQGTALALLYPFRVDFYKQMGFGEGTKMNQYQVSPGSLPHRGSKRDVVYLGKADKDAIIACYQRYASRTHGMIDKQEYECRSMFDTPENIIVGCKQGERVTGYLVFAFRKASDENVMLNNMLVKEFVYETREALSQLLTFLNSQADQVHRIIFNTQDEHFHYLLADPRNGTNRLLPHVYHESHTAGVGLMYRVIDVPGIFRQLASRPFGVDALKLKLTICDSFLPENDGSTVVHFQGGMPAVVEDGEYEVEAHLDISHFSSLLMGAVPFSRLYQYGFADLSDPDYLEPVNRLFRSEEKPVCTTALLKEVLFGILAIFLLSSVTSTITRLWKI